MSVSSALEKFESLSSYSDVIKVTKTSGTLADLFETHKTDFIASGKRTYHPYKTLRSTIAGSGLLPETTIAEKSLQTRVGQFSITFINTYARKIWKRF